MISPLSFPSISTKGAALGVMKQNVFSLASLFPHIILLSFPQILTKGAAHGAIAYSNLERMEVKDWCVRACIEVYLLCPYLEPILDPNIRQTHGGQELVRACVRALKCISF